MAKNTKSRSEEIAEKYRRRAAERHGSSVSKDGPAGQSDEHHISGRDTIDSLLRSAGKLSHRRPDRPASSGTNKIDTADAETAEETEIAEELAENVQEMISEEEAESVSEETAETEEAEDETPAPAEKKTARRRPAAGPVPVPSPKEQAMPPVKEPDPDVVMRSVSAVRRHDDIVRNRNRRRRKKSGRGGGISTGKLLAACAAVLALVVLFVVIIPRIKTGGGKNGSQTVQNESQGMNAEGNSMQAEESVTDSADETAGTMDETGESETGTAAESQTETAAADAVAPEDKPPAIALTFDDGPSDKTTNELLDVLEQYNAHATFFIVGERVEGNEAILQREWDLGCELGNHTWSHAHLRKSSKETRDTEIAKCTQAVEAAVPGGKVTVIRPPYGADNPEIKQELELPIILWSLDTLDWKTRDPDKTYDNIMDNGRGGDIILMHDIHAETIEAAKRVIPKLVEEGYKLVTVSELYEYYNEPLKLHVNHTYSGPKRIDED